MGEGDKEGRHMRGNEAFRSFKEERSGHSEGVYEGSVKRIKEMEKEGITNTILGGRQIGG